MKCYRNTNIQDFQDKGSGMSEPSISFPDVPNYKLALAKGHMPSASEETDPCASPATDLQHALKTVQGGQ